MPVILRGCDFFRTSIALQSQAPLSAVVRAGWRRGGGSAQSRVDRFFPIALVLEDRGCPAQAG